MSVGAPGSREVAHRVFAVEFDESTHSFTSGEGERAPKYVVSPTGALMNRVFAVGVLTAVDQVNDETVRARIADPTGVFVVYASQYQPDARSALQEIDAPAFVAITGKANTFTPEGGDRAYTSIRPEAVATVDAETRDHWNVTTAEQTLERIGRLAAALERETVPDDGVGRAIEAYDPQPAYVSGLYELCVEVLEVVTGERESVETEPSLELQGDASVPLADLASLSETAPAPEAPAEPEPDIESAPEEDEIEESEPDIESAPEVDEAEEAEPAEDAAPDEAFDPADEPVVSADERAEVEANFGTEFSTGDEIESPDTQDETEEHAPPDTEEIAEPAIDAPIEEEPDDLETTAPEEDEEGSEPIEEEADALDDQVVDVLGDLDEGDGVSREELIEVASERLGADPDAIDEAIQTAMMDGQCYEPAEGVVKPV